MSLSFTVCLSDMCPATRSHCFAGILYCFIASFDVVFIEFHGFNLGQNGLAFLVSFRSLEGFVVAADDILAGHHRGCGHLLRRLPAMGHLPSQAEVQTWQYVVHLHRPSPKLTVASSQPSSLKIVCRSLCSARSSSLHRCFGLAGPRIRIGSRRFSHPRSGQLQPFSCSKQV